jgi:hypothetical protein
MKQMNLLCLCQRPMISRQPWQKPVEYQESIDNLGESIQPLLEQETKAAKNVQAEKRKNMVKKCLSRASFLFLNTREADQLQSQNYQCKVSGFRTQAAMKSDPKICWMLNLP